MLFSPPPGFGLFLLPSYPSLACSPEPSASLLAMKVYEYLRRAYAIRLSVSLAHNFYSGSISSGLWFECAMSSIDSLMRGIRGPQPGASFWKVVEPLGAEPCWKEVSPGGGPGVLQPCVLPVHFLLQPLPLAPTPTPPPWNGSLKL